jgi:putative NADH-flavin reductase
MRIVIFGAGGQVAQRMAREARDRGHEVVGVARNAAVVRSDNERMIIVPEHKAESLDSATALEVYRTMTGDLDWTYISPAAEPGPGTRTGSYRGGDDSLLVDDEGRGFVSYEDYAKALVDEIEHPTHPRARMAVAY